MTKTLDSKTTNLPIRILFQSKTELFDRYGGDTMQIQETKKALENLGVNVDIDLSLKPNVEKYDIVHVFNIDWVCESYWQIKNAKDQGKKVVLSPIHHSLKEFENYEKNARYGLASIGNFLIPHQPTRDAARNFIKGFSYPQKIYPSIQQFFMGIRKQQKLSVEMADCILVQTNIEATDLKEDYITNGFSWKKVINGVNAERFKNPDFKGAAKYLPKNPYIICVGRIEPRKNQLALVEALADLRKTNPKFKDWEIFFAGFSNNHHPTYVKKFNNLVKKYSFVHHPGFIDQKVLVALYAQSSMFVCPSWFETTGLVYIEAVAAGCKSIVASGKRAKEYLADNAVYCKPSDLSSIKSAISKAYTPTVKKGFKEIVFTNYSWDKTAKQTLQVYKKILNI